MEGQIQRTRGPRSLKSSKVAIEQLTYLLFLKMAHERIQPPLKQPSIIPKEYDWPSLFEYEGIPLERHYRDVLQTLGREPGMLGVIFRKAQNRIQDPAKLRRLISDLIDKEQWMTLDADVKGDAYEGLLEKNAEDTKSGAGQYFTPRALIRAIVDAMRPRPGQNIFDPACGTGGFLLAAHEYISNHSSLDKDQKKHLRFEALKGVEIVDNTARLCAMNLYLHGIGGDACPVRVADSLSTKPSDAFDMVLTNPPFGKKSSVTVINEEGEQSKESLVIRRDDFWASTSTSSSIFFST
jgi:type I restriction enzyme M protein